LWATSVGAGEIGARLPGETPVPPVCEPPINVLGIWEAERTFGIRYRADGIRHAISQVRLHVLRLHRGFGGVNDPGGPDVIPGNANAQAQSLLVDCSGVW